MMKKYLLFLCLSALSTWSFGQVGVPEWFAKASGIDQSKERKITPDQYHLASVDADVLKEFMSGLGNYRTQGQVIRLPDPQGGMQSFYIWESSIMDEQLQQRYTGIRTYTGVHTEDPNVTAKFDFTEYGFHGIVFSAEGTYYIDPLYREKHSQEYQIYYKENYRPADKKLHPCLVSDKKGETDGRSDEINHEHRETVTALRTHGHVRKQYRLALSCTGEYAQAVTGSSFPTKAEVLSAMVTTMNRVNGIYEKELGVRMVLIANNDEIIYTHPSTDPYTANDNGYLLMGQNQSNMVTEIGLANFDIGHIFSTGGGGVASLASVCYNSEKARGVTGLDVPFGDPYDVDFVSHEMGHQFGALHSFNNCDGNESPAAAYEPGSGSTIMGYAGLCGSLNDLQVNSNDYFHPISLHNISTYISGESYGGTGTCGVSSPGTTAITIPAYASTYYIPINTPFELMAPQAEWLVPESIMYSWEQYDLGQVGRNETVGATATEAPIFRSYPPSAAGQYRSFPRADSVHNNSYRFTGERLPIIGRAVTAKLTARAIDGDGFGTFRISDDVITVNIVETAEAFKVTSPNGTEIYTPGQTVSVSWNPGGSTAAPVSTGFVDVLLSVDGGKTYTYTLAEEAANTGSVSVSLPEGAETSRARIKVKGHNNVFYDVSDQNFTITGAPTSIAGITKEEFNIYPNPVSEVLTIEYDKMNEAAFISIVNVRGEEVIRAERPKSPQLSIEHLSPGVYFIRIYNAETGQYGVKSFVKK